MTLKLFPVRTAQHRYTTTAKRLCEAGLMFAVVGVPWDMLADHAVQFAKNHNQSMARLASAGGLEAADLLAVLEGVPWLEREMDEIAAHERLSVLVSAWYSKSRAAGLI